MLFARLCGNARANKTLSKRASARVRSQDDREVTTPVAMVVEVERPSESKLLNFNAPIKHVFKFLMPKVVSFVLDVLHPSIYPRRAVAMPCCSVCRDDNGTA